MDPRENPYTPNAGARPPLFVGRDEQLDSFDVLLSRLERGRTERSMILTGLRGVGKTVLLGRFEDHAAQRGWATVDTEITRDVPFGRRMVALARQALLQLSPKSKWKDRATRAAGVLRSFELTVDSTGALSAGLNTERVEGKADTGDLGPDLTDLFLALGEAAADHGTGVVFLVDEIQFLAVREFEALIAALHKTVQRSLPITLVGAGLPQIPRLAGEAKSYAERLFTFPELGRLDEQSAGQAIAGPAHHLGVDFHPDALRLVVTETEGYPFFLQEFGRVLWNHTPASPITAADVHAAQPAVEHELDASFFRVRAGRTTDLELRYLRAMAELGPGSHRASTVAQVLGRTADQLGQIRTRLIDKGLLYAPSYGLAAFTVPQFDRYMRRTHPLPPVARPT